MSEKATITIEKDLDFGGTIEFEIEIEIEDLELLVSPEEWSGDFLPIVVAREEGIESSSDHNVSNLTIGSEGEGMCFPSIENYTGTAAKGSVNIETSSRIIFDS